MQESCCKNCSPKTAESTALTQPEVISKKLNEHYRNLCVVWRSTAGESKNVSIASELTGCALPHKKRGDRVSSRWRHTGTHFMRNTTFTSERSATHRGKQKERSRRQRLLHVLLGWGRKTTPTTTKKIFIISEEQPQNAAWPYPADGGGRDAPACSGGAAGGKLKAPPLGYKKKTVF